MLCQRAFAKPDPVHAESRGESQRFLDINGWRNGLEWLFESDLCVWVISIVFPEA